MAQEHSLPTHKPVSSSERKPRPGKPFRKSLIRSELLFAVLLVFAQAALGFLSNRFSSLFPWLVGTLLCYLLFSFLSALTGISLQENAQKRREGWVSGLLTGLFGAGIGSLVVLFFLGWQVKIALDSPPPSGGYAFGHTSPPPGLQMIFLLFFFLIFLLVNFAGILFGILGGLFGGFLRKRFH